MKNFDHDILLGLDMMTRHYVTINLKERNIFFPLENVKVNFHNENSDVHKKFNK